MEDHYVKERERSRIPDKYKWNLTEIYSSDEAWEEAKQELITRFSQIPVFAGKLSNSAEQLLGCLEKLDGIRKEFVRLACYASMKSDLDTRDAKYLAMDQQMSQIGSDLSALSSFIEPEILRIGRDGIDVFLDREPRLAIYRHILDDILRKKDHTPPR